MVLGGESDQYRFGRPRRTGETSPATCRWGGVQKRAALLRNTPKCPTFNLPDESPAYCRNVLIQIFLDSFSDLACEQQQFSLLREAVGSQHEAKIDRQNHKQRLSGVQSNVK